MERNNVIVITGAAGFIGSYLLGHLNENGYDQIIIVDDFNDEDKWFNFDSKQFIDKVQRDVFFEWVEKEKPVIQFFFHLGARTDTTEFDYGVLKELNVDYSKKVWKYCVNGNIPLIYASSAATYGAGELGYNDDHDLAQKLQPLNPYGISKNEFDKWVLAQNEAPPFWAGLKFFNVYGPNEYHKERMASMIYHGYNQIKKTGKVRLFKSHRPDFRDGEQLRDFIYVNDVVRVCSWLMDARPESGLYNLGTGQARSFKDLMNALFSSVNLPPQIEYIDMPEDIRDKYQYYTEAKMSKLVSAGYNEQFYSIEEGVQDYVRNYLSNNRYY